MSQEIDQHAIVVMLKDLALELGRTPLRDEFTKLVSRHHVEKAFGSFSTLLQACGLESAQSKKITNQIFEQNISRHLEKYQPREDRKKLDYPHLVCINDIHWPFHAQKVIDRFYRYVGDEKPEYVLLNGDARDRYSHARFPRSHNVFTPREEDALSEKLNREFWEEVKKLSPKSKCIQMMGNHDIRPLKMVLDAYPEAEDWIKQALEKSFTFDGVKTIFDPREELMLSGDIMVHHGYKSGLGEHRDYSHYNCIIGHTHKAGIVYRNVRNSVLWEMNTGYAGDPEAKGLSYTSQKITIWTQGFGVVNQDGPRIILI